MEGKINSTFSRLSLKFTDKSIEEEFRKDYFAKSLRKHRAALLMATFLYAVFGLLDWIIIPEQRYACWIIRFCFVCPLLIWTYFFSYSHQYQKIQSANALLVGLTASIGLIGIISIASTPGNYLYYAGLLLCVLFYFEFIPNQVISNILAWSTFGFYVTAAVLFTSTPWPFLFNNIFILFFFNIAGMFVCYSLESSQRKEYLHRRTIQLQADQLSQALCDVEKERRRVEELSQLDPLTGLANRRHFFVEAEREFRRKNRLHHSLTVMMLDLDYFKTVNDTYGHAIGDQVLQKVAAIIACEVRCSDRVCRYGGEEFAVLLPETGYNSAIQLGKRLLQKIAQSSILTGKGPVCISASMGIAALESEETATIEVLLERADEALYLAKNAGRNQLRIWRLLTKPGDCRPLMLDEGSFEEAAPT